MHFLAPRSFKNPLHLPLRALECFLRRPGEQPCRVDVLNEGILNGAMVVLRLESMSDGRRGHIPRSLRQRLKWRPCQCGFPNRKMPGLGPLSIVLEQERKEGN